jgi:hypothetical protein
MLGVHFRSSRSMTTASTTVSPVYSVDANSDDANSSILTDWPPRVPVLMSALSSRGEPVTQMGYIEDGNLA